MEMEDITPKIKSFFFGIFKAIFGTIRAVAVLVVLAVVLFGCLYCVVRCTQYSKSEPDAVDETESMQKALTALKVLNESQYKHYMFSANARSYAASIQKLGYAGDDVKGGLINVRYVWEADTDSPHPRPIGKSNSEYLLKMAPIKNATGYAAFAVPQKEGYPAYMMVVDFFPDKGIVQSLLAPVYEIKDATAKEKIKTIASSKYADMGDIKFVFDKGRAEPVSNFEIKIQEGGKK